MSERLRNNSARYRCTNPSKMSESDLGPRKTLFVVVVVVGCFAVLWPKVFYPMLVGPTHKPSDLDQGCCDVFSETDVNTIKIFSELCCMITQQSEGQKPLTNKEIIANCKAAVYSKCGIDISVVLQEQVGLGRTVKQILDEIRSLNGSLCLKYHFGISPWILGVPHRVVTNVSVLSVRQERPVHLRPEMLHPALREKGRAIPPTSPPIPASRKVNPPPKIVEGRPGPIPGMRPPMGGAGHVVPPPQKGNSISVIMPIYTIGIVIFFIYTLMKVIFKKKPEGPGFGLYPTIEPDRTFRKEVFESEKNQLQSRFGRSGSGKLVVNAMSALLDEVDQELESRWKACEVESQNLTSNGSVPGSKQQDQTSVKVLGMEMTASCEGGQKWSRPNSPIIPPSPPPVEEPEPPQEIYLEGSLPAQSQLLVSDSKTETEPNIDSSADPAVVLASKMTLSVISLDSLPETENGSTSSSGKDGEEYEFVNKSDVNLLRNENEQALHSDASALVKDDLYDDSKYITASGLTNAENDVSEGELTDGEVDIEIDNDEEYNQYNHEHTNEGIVNDQPSGESNEEPVLDKIINDSNAIECPSTAITDTQHEFISDEQLIGKQTDQTVSEEPHQSPVAELSTMTIDGPVIIEDQLPVNNQAFVINDQDPVAIEQGIDVKNDEEANIDSVMDEVLNVAMETVTEIALSAESTIGANNSTKIEEITENQPETKLDVENQSSNKYNTEIVSQQSDLPVSDADDDAIFAKIYMAHAGPYRPQENSLNTREVKEADKADQSKSASDLKAEESTATQESNKNDTTSNIPQESQDHLSDTIANSVIKRETAEISNILQTDPTQAAAKEHIDKQEEREIIEEYYLEDVDSSELEGDSNILMVEEVIEVSDDEFERLEREQEEKKQKEKSAVTVDDHSSISNTTVAKVDSEILEADKKNEFQGKVEHLISSIETASDMIKDMKESPKKETEKAPTTGEKVTDLDDDDVSDFDFNKELERIKKEMNEYGIDLERNENEEEQATRNEV